MADQPKTRGQKMAEECVYRTIQGSAHCVGVAFQDIGQVFVCERTVEVADGLKAVIASMIDAACAEAIRGVAAAGGPRPLPDVLARMIAEIPGPDQGLKWRMGLVLRDAGRFAPEEYPSLWNRAGEIVRESTGVSWGSEESCTDWQRRVMAIFTGMEMGK